MAIDLIAECSLLSNRNCGVLVKDTCSLDPSECNIFLPYFEADSYLIFMEFTVSVLLLAFAFRVGKKMLLSKNTGF